MPRITSRLERQEKKKILRQTVFFVGLALVIGLAFIFLIIPNFIRILNALFQTNITTEEDTFPPQVPALAAPPQATSSATLPLSGFGEAESEVVFVLNGSESTRETIQEDGTFTTEVSLVEGQNTVAAYSIDPAGNESTVSRNYEVQLDSEEPTLELSDIEDGDTIEGKANQQFTISGTTEPNARLYVNGRLSSADAEGKFAIPYYLQEGENELEIRAEDAARNTTSLKLTLTFRP